jgi:ABC-type sulfate transport system permease subunit
MPELSVILGQSGTGESTGEFIAVVIYIAVVVLMVAGMWKTFEKANQPGWGAIIPIYNVILLLKVAGKPIWWLVLMIIPLANVIVGILVPIAVARNFGKGVGFGLGLLFLPFIFYPILGFGDAEYGPEGIPVVGVSDQFPAGS